MSRGPDFTRSTVDALAKRAAQTCSNPACRASTSGPHSVASKAVILGEAAHIWGARREAARYDPAMTDAERADPANGIWLCRACAKRVDADERGFPAAMLIQWKAEHEKWIEVGGRTDSPAGREIVVTGGGVGSVLVNTGNGKALDLSTPPGQTGERIRVDGEGIGEIVVNAGEGTAKSIRSINAPATETKTTVRGTVHDAFGMSSSLMFPTCPKCGSTYPVSKCVQGEAGATAPTMEVRCPHCRESHWV